jgi:hypothetical protein
VEVVQHNSLEWLEEILLEVIVPEFLFHEELICELAEGIDGVEGYIKILVGADYVEML